VNAVKLKTKRSENAGPDHVGNDQERGGKKGDGFPLILSGYMIYCRIMHQPGHQRISKGIWGSSTTYENISGHLQAHRTFPYKDNKRESKVNGAGFGLFQETLCNTPFSSVLLPISMESSLFL
jgi:hypothetical protein